jgi:16S rRNA (cytosine967-C5)-methyltransferase
MSPAREIAFRILRRVHGGGYASELLRSETASLNPRDAGLAEALVFGCLRYQAQLDYLIAHFSGRREPKLDEEVRIALRMGIFQLRYLERIPAHAAVTESVDLVKRAHKRSAAGFVNAVLRKPNPKPVKWPDRTIELSMPGWLLERWQKHYGREVAEAIAWAALKEPEATTNPVTGRQQDPTSQAIVPLLEVEPGMTLLDVCAAPGNKTAQALAAGARVVACDRYLKRLTEVSTEAVRVVADATSPLPFSARFDRILVDAPCSGTGTLARNPEIKWRLKSSDLERFSLVQRRILENSLCLLKPGGRLVYSTCSLEPEENEAVAINLAVKETHVWLPGQSGVGDGFFAAVITSGKI